MECEHDWKYLFGQGKWHQCEKCHVVGNKFSRERFGEIVPVTCDVKDCNEPAVKFSVLKGVKCGEHSKNSQGP